MRTYTLDRSHGAIDPSAAWECHCVVAIPGPVNSLINPPHQWMLDWFAEGMKRLVSHGNGTGVQLLLQDAPFTYLPTALDMKDTAAPHRAGGRGQPRYLQQRLHQGGSAGSDPHAGRPGQERPHLGSAYDEFLHARLGTGVVEPGPAEAALRDIGYSCVTVLEIVADAMQPGADPDADIRASHAILVENGWPPLG